MSEIRTNAPECQRFVPRAFGTFWVEGKKGFLHEDAGISLNRLYALEGVQLNSGDIEALKTPIRETVAQLHESGRLHGDIALRNICVRHRRADVASAHNVPGSDDVLGTTVTYPTPSTPPRLPAASTNPPPDSPDTDDLSSAGTSGTDSSPFEKATSEVTTVFPGSTRSARTAPPFSVNLGQRGYLEVMPVDFSDAISRDKCRSSFAADAESEKRELETELKRLELS